MSKSSSNANRETSGGEKEREREGENRKRGREERERGRMRGVGRGGVSGFQGCTFPVPEERKCMAMHYLARPVLVLFIKEHGWSNTRLRLQRRGENE